MGTLHLVRHGQASFGAADYDQLSELGQRQCRRLGEHLKCRGLRFEATLSGTLRRQMQSLDAIADGLGGAPAPQRLAGLNEYDSGALLDALFPVRPPPPDPSDAVRHHFRLLRQALQAWIEARTQPVGMPSHRDFVAGVAMALDLVREQHRGDVLMVSSGGPIAAAVGLVLGLAPPAVIDLNLRLRNSALTEFAFTPRRHVLVSFNGISHLEHGVGADWVSYT